MTLTKQRENEEPIPILLLSGEDETGVNDVYGII
jgi:hypothetical protein